MSQSDFVNRHAWLYGLQEYFIGTAYAGDQSNGVDNKQLIDINEIIRFHPIEMIGYELRDSMTAMKKIV